MLVAVLRARATVSNRHLNRSEKLLMHRLALLASVTAIWSGVTVPAMPQTSSTNCRTNAGTASALGTRVQQMVTAFDSVRLAESGLLPVDTAAVALVTTDSSCAQATAAFNAAVRQTGGPRASSVYLIRAGANRYLVVVPESRSGHYLNYLVFDGTWTLLARLAG